MIYPTEVLMCFISEMSEKRGSLIAIEGCTLALENLISNLEKTETNILVFSFPEPLSSLGSLVHLTQDGHAQHLLSSANRWERAPAILSALASGTHVVITNYAYDGAAKSVAKVRYIWFQI